MKVGGGSCEKFDVHPACTCIVVYLFWLCILIWTNKKLKFTTFCLIFRWGPRGGGNTFFRANSSPPLEILFNPPQISTHKIFHKTLNKINKFLIIIILTYIEIFWWFLLFQGDFKKLGELNSSMHVQKCTASQVDYFDR